MPKKFNVILCLIFACAFLIDGCAQTPLAIHEKLDRKSLNLITSTDVFLITTQNGPVAEFSPDYTAANNAVVTASQYAPPTGAGLVGLLLGSLFAHHIEAKDNAKKEHYLEQQIQKINNSMQGYSIGENFSEKLTTNLHELKWLNSSNTNIVNATSDRHMLDSILDEANSPLVMTVKLSYSFNQNLDTYQIDAVATLYPKSKNLQPSSNHEPGKNLDGHPILYRNNFYYAQTLKGAHNIKTAANIWSNITGPDYIRDVTENGLNTLAKLITYDISLYPYNLKDKYAKTHVSASDGSGTIKGTLIAENKYMISLRTKSGYIYCLPRTN